MGLRDLADPVVALLPGRCRCGRGRPRTPRSWACRRGSGRCPAPGSPGTWLFQQISVMSRSNTAMPWSTLSMADCSRSRLCWMAAEASSSSCMAPRAWVEWRSSMQRDHQARGGHAHGAGQQMLGKADEPHIGLRRTGLADLPLLARKLGEGGARPRRRRCSGRPSSSRRSAVTAVRHSLKPVPRPGWISRDTKLVACMRSMGGGLAHQRDRHIGGDIGEQAPHHAVGERIELHDRTACAA